MDYLVPAGLYAIGMPTPHDPVLVTANYKMSYDIVRRSMAGRNVWLLVLETFGVNVWCAAGKGTFGTRELVARIEKTALAKVVSHRRLILPILGAPGIAAHEVQNRTGFSVSYATIRADELTDYLDNGMVATPGMRELSFTFRERLVLVPVEVMLAWRSLAVAGVLLFVAAYLAAGPAAGIRTLVAFLGAALAGLVATPLLLPCLPGRSFSLKGAAAGIAWVALFFTLAGFHGSSSLPAVSAFLALPAVSSYYALSFTGCTPFTSRSGVKREMWIALPLMGVALLLGGVLALAGALL
jgi:acetyl-CoA decarbonylase/synthase complex subunit gamma